MVNIVDRDTFDLILSTLSEASFCIKKLTENIANMHIYLKQQLCKQIPMKFSCFLDSMNFVCGFFTVESLHVKSLEIQLATTVAEFHIIIKHTKENSSNLY